MRAITILSLLLLGASGTAVSGQPVPTVESKDNLSDSDRMTQAKSDIANMSSILTKVIKHLSAAREEKDAVKLNCVNEKLTKIKGLLKISEQADVAMQEAMARKDSATVAAEYTKISISQQKCLQLAADSEACIGELAAYAGDDQVEVSNENESPYKEENLSADTADVIVIERPTEASPYQ